MPRYTCKTLMPVSAEELYAWHTRPGAFERLTPPWEDVEIISPPDGLEDGSEVVLQVNNGPIGVKWVARHHGVQPGREFRDRQVAGPFASWEHRHRMIPRDDRSSYLEDQVEYQVPLGLIGRKFAGSMVRHRIDRMFRYRHEVTRNDLHAHLKGDAEPMRILISGSTGLVGGRLVSFLTSGGHDVVRLVRSRRPGDESSLLWDPTTGLCDDSSRLEGFDAVIHLAGESIASGRWTAAQKRRIEDSRVQGTRVLAEALARCETKPKVLLCASAIGYYGDRGAEKLSESAAPGRGFLAQVAEKWEAASQPAADAGIRVVNLRFGMILSPKGGALKKMLPAFKFGFGGRLGSGEQCVSWIALDDVVGAIHHVLGNDHISGPINLVSPNSVSNNDFAATLASVLGRPKGPPAPRFALRLALGDMADELLLAGANVHPVKLQETDYEFLYPRLEDALRHLLGR